MVSLLHRQVASALLSRRLLPVWTASAASQSALALIGALRAASVQLQPGRAMAHRALGHHGHSAESEVRAAHLVAAPA